MSRIGKQPVKIPAGVSVEITNTLVNLKGPKGTLSPDEIAPRKSLTLTGP